MAEKAKIKLKRLWERGRIFFTWVLISLLAGAGIGAAGTAFYFALNAATAFRVQNGWMVWFLPAAGVLIVFLYRAAGIKNPQGTDLVLTAVRSPEPVPFAMAPLIFVSTLLTHLAGGSAGREGAALQIGGSLGFQLGKRLRLDEKELHVMVLCGMSAAFSALFGTPVTAAVFAMEVVSVGVMYYAALVPCAVAALTAAAVARRFGAAPAAFAVRGVPGTQALPFFSVGVLALLCAGVSVLFCVSLQSAGRLYRKYLKNPYARAAAGGALVLLLMLLCGSRDYLGAGMDVIRASLNGTTRPEAFLLKILFTAVTLGAGFKGGEIVPSFFIGASFGCLAGGFLGLDPSFAAAVGLVSVFCGVTNCPLTALVLSVELFGGRGTAFFLLACAVSYMLSGYGGLYGKQRILYSKFRPEWIGSRFLRGGS